MAHIPPIEDGYIDGIIKSAGPFNPALNKTQGVKLRELVKLLRDRLEHEIQEKHEEVELAIKEKVDKEDLFDEQGLINSSLLPAYVDGVLDGSYINVNTFHNPEGVPYTPESGKIYVDVATNKTYRWSGSQYVTIGTDLALGETSATAYRGDRGKAAFDHSQILSGNPHNTSKSDIGLGNVDNTSDANKPISTATQTALDGKAALAHTHSIGQVISLQAALDGKESTFPKGSLVAGTGIALAGTLANRLVGTGNITLNFDQAWGDARYTLVGSIPDAQTLSLGNNPGQIAISGGNSVTLSSIYSDSRQDANERVLNQAFTPYRTVAGMINYPSGTIGTGLRIERYSSAASQLGLDFYTNGVADGAGNIYPVVFLKTFGASVERPWNTIASREWAASYGLSAVGQGALLANLDNANLAGGFYSHGTTAAGNPFPNSSGGMINFRSGVENGSTIQIGMLGDNTAVPRMAIRHADNTGVFSPWREVWHDGNFTPDTKLNLTGGTLTGQLNGTTATFNGLVTASTAPTAAGHLANKAYVDAQSVLESLNEGDGIGYRIRGRNPVNYGPIGLGAVDLSLSGTASTTRGATGQLSFAVGSINTASGDISFSAGANNVSQGVGSVTLGSQNQVTGIYSVAMGANGIISGNYSATVGHGNTVSSLGSFASGDGNTVSGTLSMSLGHGNIANNYASLVLGRFSTGGAAQGSYSPGSAAIKIGDGTSATNRSDSYVVYNDGNSTQKGVATASGFFTDGGLEVQGTALLHFPQRSGIAPVSPRDIPDKEYVDNAFGRMFVYTTSGAGATFTIPHGLSYTPTMVQVTPNTALAAGYNNESVYPVPWHASISVSNVVISFNIGSLDAGVKTWTILVK